jgi:hypothetical protein
VSVPTVSRFVLNHFYPAGYYIPALNHLSDILNARFPGARVSSLEPYDLARFWRAYLNREPDSDSDSDSNLNSDFDSDLDYHEGDVRRGGVLKGCCSALGAFLVDRQEVLKQRRRVRLPSPLSLLLRAAVSISLSGYPWLSGWDTSWRLGLASTACAFVVKGGHQTKEEGGDRAKASRGGLGPV